MKKLNDNWLIFNDETSLSKALAQEILIIAKKSILENDSFNIVLTGGRSVLSLYKILSESDSNWNKWHIYISDERFLSAGHKDRNDRLINEIWLDNSAIPKQNIHFIKAELGLLKAREEYENILKGIDRFDVVLLSVGEDGHVASLFPGCTYNNKNNVVIEKNSPKLPRERISISYRKFNKADFVYKIIIGSSKNMIVKKIKEGIMLPALTARGKNTCFFVCNDYA